MTDRVTETIDRDWREAAASVEGIGARDLVRLATASAVIDRVWDRHIFEFAETFGGTEIGYARALSAKALERLLECDYAALVSVAGSEIHTSGNETLDAALASARREALDNFSSDLLGPVRVDNYLVYAQPMLGDSPVPIGAAVLTTREPLTAIKERLLGGFLAELDTRLNIAEQLLKLRWQNIDLGYEIKMLKGETSVAQPARQKYVPLPEDAEGSLTEIAGSVATFDLFGVPLPGEHFGDFCRNLDAITTDYLKIFSAAKHLYLDIPSGIDAKDEDSKLAAPYHRLFEIMQALRPAARLLYHTTADDLAPYTATGRAPTFSDLTRVAMSRTEDESLRRILEIMNDQGEEAELEALVARNHPYEFRTANVGEVFALLALHRTVSERMAEGGQWKGQIARSLRKYQAARAYLLSYDRFEDVPLKGADRTESPDAEKLLLIREKAPSFGVLLAALSK